MTYTEPLFAPHSSQPTPTAIEPPGAAKELDTPSDGSDQPLRDLSVDRGGRRVLHRGKAHGLRYIDHVEFGVGLEAPTTGDVSVPGRPVTGIGCEIGYVVQTAAVIHWRLSKLERSSS